MLQKVLGKVGSIRIRCLSNIFESSTYSKILATIGLDPIILKFRKAKKPCAIPAAIASRNEPLKASAVITAPQRQAIKQRTISRYGSFDCWVITNDFHPCSGIHSRLITFL